MSDQVQEQIIETQTPDTTPEQPNQQSEQPVKEVVEPSLAKKLANKRPVAPPIEEKAAVAAYAPNFKFKANNKEHEFPEFIRTAIKDAETEKNLRQIYEKAHGLDLVKEKYQSVREEYKQVNTAYNTVMDQVREAATAYQRNDLDSVFETFKINPEKVLQWAVEKVQLSQLPPDQRQAYEAKRSAEKNAYSMEKQFQRQSEETMQTQAQYLSQMLDLVLERPDYSNAAQAYDARKGKPGAFRELVIKVGESEAALTGKVLTPIEASQKALEWLGESPASAKPAPAAAPAQATPAETAPQKEPQKKTTMPNLANAGARPGAAPGKSKMKSIDDLKRKYDEMANNN